MFRIDQMQVDTDLDCHFQCDSRFRALTVRFTLGMYQAPAIAS
jgi:hypothetical protein